MVGLDLAICAGAIGARAIGGRWPGHAWPSRQGPSLPMTGAVTPGHYGKRQVGGNGKGQVGRNGSGGQKGGAWRHRQVWGETSRSGTANPPRRPHVIGPGQRKSTSHLRAPFRLPRRDDRGLASRSRFGRWPLRFLLRRLRRQIGQMLLQCRKALPGIGPLPHQPVGHAAQGERGRIELSCNLVPGQRRCHRGARAARADRTRRPPSRRARCAASRSGCGRAGRPSSRAGSVPAAPR